MNEQKLLLRVPELGAPLGKLIGGTPRKAGWIPLDAVRHRLVTRVLEQAGRARQLAADEECTAALAAIGSATWREAWDEAVAQVVEQIAERVDSHLQEEAKAVRMGRRRRARVRLGAADRRAISARIGSAGASLMPALDALERLGEAVAMGREAAVDDWQRALTVAARRLEASWLELEQTLDDEAMRWRSVANQVAAWRKPMWPVVAVGLVALAVATWLGLILGGYLDPPQWLAQAWTAVFGP